MSYTYILNSTNINQYITNKPAIILESRDKYKYFSFNGGDISLKLKNNATVLALLTEDAFLTISRKSEVIWTGYCNSYSLNNPGKNQHLSITFKSELGRIKDIVLHHDNYGNYSASDIMDEIVSNINAESGLSGYTWDGDQLDNDVIIVKGNHLLHYANGDPIIGGDVGWAGYYMNELSEYPGEVYFTIDLDFGGPTYYEVNLSIIAAGTTSGTPVDISSTEDIPYVGDDIPCWVGTDGGDSIEKIYYKYETTEEIPELILGDEYMACYGEFYPWETPSIKYDDKKISDGLLDICKCSDSTFYILNKVIYLFNNQTGASTTTTEPTVIEDKESYRKKYDYTELSLSLTEETGEIIKDALEFHYYLKFGNDTTIYDLELITELNYKVGYILTVDGTNYGRINSIKYSTENENFVKIKTEKAQED